MAQMCLPETDRNQIGGLNSNIYVGFSNPVVVLPQNMHFVDKKLFKRNLQKTRVEAEEPAKHRGVDTKKKGKSGAKLSAKYTWTQKEVGECTVTCVSVLVYYVHSILAHPLSIGGSLSLHTLYRQHSPRSRAQLRNKNKLQFQTGG